MGCRGWTDLKREHRRTRFRFSHRCLVLSCQDCTQVQIAQHRCAVMSAIPVHRTALLAVLGIPRSAGERFSGSLQPLSNAAIISKPRRSDTTRIRFTVNHHTAGHDDHTVTFTTALRRLVSTLSTAFASFSVLHDVERPPLIEQPDKLAVLVINNNTPRFLFSLSLPPLQVQRIDNSTCLLSLYTA